MSSLALILGLERLARRIPAMIVAVLVSIVVTKALMLEKDHGVHIVGNVPSGLPQFGLPDVAAKDYLDLIRDALAIMLLSLVEGLAAAKSFAAKNGYDVNANQELIGLGAANVGAGLSAGMVVGGGVSKTAVNARGSTEARGPRAEPRSRSQAGIVRRSRSTWLAVSRGKSRRRAVLRRIAPTWRPGSSMSAHVFASVLFEKLVGLGFDRSCPTLVRGDPPGGVASRCASAVWRER